MVAVARPGTGAPGREVSSAGRSVAARRGAAGLWRAGGGGPGCAGRRGLAAGRARGFVGGRGLSAALLPRRSRSSPQMGRGKAER